MKRIFVLGALVLLGLQSALVAERPYFNDLKAPENGDDILAIQSALQSSLQKAREATVCVLLKEGSGSGVIISEDGLVLSAAHVTAGVNQKMKVKLEDGREYEAQSLGLNSANDAAMLQIITEEKLPFVQIEPKVESGIPQVELGDWVFSIGHSGGFDKARGAVVRLGRVLRSAKDTMGSDCVLIGGDSGGPLFDINGVLIGIHSRVGRVNATNMHVPVQAFYRCWDQMKEGEFIGEGPFATKPKPGSGFLGITVKVVDEGLELTAVEPGYSAELAGLKVKDVLVELGGELMKSEEGLRKVLKKRSAGERLKGKVLRAGKTLEVEIELKAK